MFVLNKHKLIFLSKFRKNLIKILSFQKRVPLLLRFRIYGKKIVHWNVDTRASPGVWLLWRESDNPLTGPLNQGGQRIVKLGPSTYNKMERRKTNEFAKEAPDTYIIHSWAAPVNKQLRLIFLRRVSCGESSCVEVPV